MKSKRWLYKEDCYLGIDLGGTNFKYGILDRNLCLREYRHQPAEEFKNPKRALIFLKDLISQLLKKYTFSAVGFGLPGLVDYRKGYIYYLVNLKEWKNIKWKQLLEKALNLDVFLDNDANLAALGEYHLGAGQECRNMIMITLGTGVGGGLILSGRLYRGRNSIAGEIGHIPLSLNGPVCNCGGQACLESYIGNKRLLQRLQNLLKRYPHSLLSEIKKEKDVITLEDITFAAEEGNRLAINFWKDVADKLGLVITGLVNLLNPERIVIGGGIANAGRHLFVPLRQFVKKRAMNIPSKNVKILKSRLGEKSGIIGAALLAKFSQEGKDF